MVDSLDRCGRWRSHRYCSSIAGAYISSAAQRRKIVRNGYVRGKNDLDIYEARGGYFALMLELKEKAYPTKAQKEWIDAMNERGYCARGAMELRIKEHKSSLKSDRTSCHKFEANQLRLFFHSIAYVLIHTLQKEVLQGTEFVNSTMETIQLKLIKVAARVKELKTKIKIEFPRSCPVRTVQTKAFNIFEVLRE